MVTRDSWYNAAITDEDMGALLILTTILILVAVLLLGIGFTLVGFCEAKLAARERRKVK